MSDLLRNDTLVLNSTSGCESGSLDRKQQALLCFVGVDVGETCLNTGPIVDRGLSFVYLCCTNLSYVLARNSCRTSVKFCTNKPAESPQTMQPCMQSSLHVCYHYVRCQNASTNCMCTNVRALQAGRNMHILSAPATQCICLKTLHMSTGPASNPEHMHLAANLHIPE